ncbi:MAG: ParA family protein [Bacteroidetes bacterium]|nr:ParA family protein [Bacteroidota bacterium]MBU1680684.1 ParA family protein [Bacteroidota bacterium]MBU2505847.1 ParA family protein [Bacteroidota bacterium]
MNKIISVALPKGGVGKTATSVNLAASLAILEYKTLLIDADPSGNCAHSLNFNSSKIHGGLLDLLGFVKSLQSIIHKTAFEYLDFIPSNINTYEEEERFNRISANVTLLRNILHQAKLNYDFVIIDCPPYLRGITNLALIASKSVIIPIKSANFSLGALVKIIERISWIRKNYNTDLEIEGILHTMYESRTKASILTDKYLHDLIGEYTYHTIIPKSSSVAESTFYGKPVIQFDGQSICGEAYLKLALEILTRNKTCPLIKSEQKSRLKLHSAQLPNHYSAEYFEKNQNSGFSSIHFTLPVANIVEIELLKLGSNDSEKLLNEKLKSGSYNLFLDLRGKEKGFYKIKYTAGEFVETISIHNE